jgi:hypothetical protein
VILADFEISSMFRLFFGLINFLFLSRAIELV